MEQTSQVLREHNIKVTPQRLSVYLSFDKSKGHLSAEDVYRLAQKKVPAISLGTVYSILESFCDKGLLREIKIDFNKSLYELKENAHHHFSCRICNKIFDVHMPVCSALQNRIVDGHMIDDFQGYFYGICFHCSNGTKKK
ncbi:MAG: transcriptional repressor [Candidatus Omnitrophica bacterium]|nr:transcriptional repressor [Candidatus Omnitrophota bacterium]